MAGSCAWNEQTHFVKEAILERVDLPLKTQSNKPPNAQPTGASTPSDKNTDAQTRRSVSPWHTLHPVEHGVWAVNPENGHAYIKIGCESLEDANDRAAAEGAHLVAINDEAEQQWLLGLFGNHLYWIGPE